MASKGLLIGTVFDAPPSTDNTVECTIYDMSLNDSFGQDLKSIQLSSRNRMVSDTGLLGFANAWTLSIWFRPTAIDGTFVEELAMIGWAGQNSIALTLETDDTYRIRARSSAGSIFQEWRWDNSRVLNEWINLTVTWDGAAMVLYENGSTAVQIETTDVAASMVEFSRSVRIGDSLTDTNNIDIYSIALWNAGLGGAEVQSIYGNGSASGVNLAANGGGYSSSANLEHWWRLGLNAAPNIGQDFGIATQGTKTLVSTGSTVLNDGSVITAFPGGESDFMQTQEVALGIADFWTIAFWQRRTLSGQGSVPLWWVSTSNSAAGRIAWTQSADDQCSIEVRNDAGSSSGTDTFRFDNMFVAAPGVEWEHIVLVYNDVSGLTTYFNGVDITNKVTSVGAGDVTITQLSAGSPTQTNIARTVTIGAGVDGLIGNGEALIFNLAIWGTELNAANALALFNGGIGSTVDLLQDGNGYNESGNLLHYWRFANASDRGEDLGSAPLDLSPGHIEAFTTGDCPDTLEASFKAIDFDGIDEEMFNDTNQTLGIANEWSIQANYEPAALTNSMTMFSTRNATNQILLQCIGFSANDPLRITLRGTSGSIKVYEWISVHTIGVKVSMLFTWDGTDLLLYIDGILTAPSSTPGDTTGTMTDTARDISMGSTEGEPDSISFFEGTIHSASMWDVVLTQAQVTVLENSGTPEAFNNLQDSGAYDASANLVHYWLLGFDSGDIGKDYGTGTPINVGDNSTNITAADIVIY